MTEQTTATVAFEGVQTIAQAEAASARLRDALAAAGAIEIDLNALAEADLAFVQVLIAARKSAEKAGIGFKVHRGSVLEDVLVRAGLAASPIFDDLPANGDRP